MRCAACGYESPSGKKFCGECGVALKVKCPSCGGENAPGTKFCGDCGKPLAETAKPAASPPDPRSYTPKHLAEKILTSRSALEGERKQVTVLFADVKGSMELAEQLDPEEWHKIMDRFFAILSEGVHRFEGTINQYTGDGIMALFGAPIAHEDHARRACYAALYLRDELRRHADDLRRKVALNFSVRMGMNSGEVVVGKIGDDLRMDYTAQGHSVGLAARMEQLAEPGRVYLTEQTARLVSGFFRLRDLGPFALKGANTPVRVHDLEGVGPLHTPIEISRARGFSRFVGRVDEMAALEAALSRAIGGSAQVVGIVGEPGVGKSRLCFEFVERCRSREVQVITGHGVPHGKSIPFLPVVEAMREYFGIKQDDSEETVRDKVAGRSLRLDKELDDTLPLLYDFLGVPDPGHPPPPMQPEAKQRRLFAFLKRLTHAQSRREPTASLFEDLHWWDSGSEAFLENAVESVPGTRSLLLVNFRPEYHAAWMQKSYYQQLPLLPLGSEAISELLQDLLGKDPSLAGLADRIRERTGGNPFFIEETVQALAERGSLLGTKGSYRLVRPAAELTLPGTVQAVLAARIDRLEEREKYLLQTAAVIGREFTKPVLRRVGELLESDLSAALGKLTASEFIYEQALYPELEYTFKHALTQEVAYGSLLVERRQALHERTADAIQALFGERLEEHLSELAHHYSHSRNTEKAIEYSRLAGEGAVKGSANAEAIRHLTTALKLLETMPDSAERVEQELALQMTLAVPLLTTKGYSAREVEDVYARAQELCLRAGETPRLFPVLHGLWWFNVTRGNLRSAQELAKQLLALAESSQDPSLIVEAHYARGATLFWLGDFAPSRDHLERGIHLYDPQIHRSHAFVYGQDPGIFCTSNLALVLWLIGYPDRALAKSNEALALAHDLAHPFSVVLAIFHAAAVHQLRREPQLTERRADAVIALSAERGFSFWPWLAWIVRGWAVAQQERGAEGIGQIREGLAAIGAAGAEIGLPWGLPQLAEALESNGRADEALNVLAEAIAVSSKNGLHAYDVEIYRLKGELLLVSSRAENRAEAESCFRRAIEIARRQQAKSWELRAVTSLSRLLQKQDKKDEARRMLAEIYGWFTEGFDTADLKEAKAVLEELS